MNLVILINGLLRLINKDHLNLWGKIMNKCAYNYMILPLQLIDYYFIKGENE